MKNMKFHNEMGFAKFKPNLEELNLVRNAFARGQKFLEF